MPRFGHTKAVCREKLRHVVTARTKLMNGKNARVENKMRNRNARTAGRTGSKLRPTRAFSNKCKKPVKAAIIVFGDKVEVLHDPQLVTETESAVLLKIGRMKLGIISIYFEETGTSSHISSERKRLAKSGNRKSDHSWRHKCVEPLVESRVEVDRTATTSDHNAIVFNLRLSGPIKPMEPITTRRYNTNKADWTEFCLQLRNTLQKYGIAEKVERTKRPEDLEANSREYIAAIQEVCEEIFLKMGQRKTKANLVDSGTKRSKKTSCAKEENPQRSPEKKGRNRRLPYGQDDIHSESRNSTDRKLERVLHNQDKESMWDKVYRVIRNKKAPGPDGLTADICIAAIESEMEVFLAIANKCLAYFPTHWKTTCRHNTETWKEDYTLPKSYRPIVLSNTGSCHNHPRSPCIHLRGVSDIEEGETLHRWQGSQRLNLPPTPTLSDVSAAMATHTVAEEGREVAGITEQLESNRILLNFRGLIRDPGNKRPIT
ncbi:hypothetical protein EVAR_86555_1 [Eumeta japonica]|uniref:Retrovirus-related Pol polyprotein from type-1 retrotransposable element R1 n=1 Tax=Eumeta variegata TaxID=151549 RepID=A0A4C1ZIC2_EUMVA|nr:hypothetical protein EVAR_86555_1 [Eumeta japonica]